MTAEQSLIYSLKEEKAHLYDASVQKSLIIEKLHDRIKDLEKQIHYKDMHISTLEDNQSKVIEFLQDMRSDTPGDWKELDNIIVLLGAIPNPPLTFPRRVK